jgi:tRNA uridine 5-carboxymethylaminomethyl modification enzyme
LEKPISREYNLADLLSRPGVDFLSLMSAVDEKQANHLPNSVAEQAAQQVEIQLKYQGYIDRQADEIERLKKQENTALPEDLDYQQMQGLSNELKQKLLKAKPENIGRATRIPGMTPAAISLLLIYLKKYQAISRKAG